MNKESENTTNTTENVAYHTPKWHIAIYIIIAVTVIAAVAGVLNIYVIDHTRLVNDTVTVEAGTPYAFYPEDYFELDKLTAEDFTCDATGVDTSRLGDYIVTVTGGSKTYEIAVRVEDTKAPDTDLSLRYVYTNDPSDVDVSGIYSYEDATDCTTEVEKYELLSEPVRVTDDVLSGYTETIVALRDTEELMEREDFIPEDDGIYSALIVTTDEAGNRKADEIIVIVDTQAPGLMLEDDTAAGFDDLTVEQDDVAAEPSYGLQGAEIVDDVDGNITSAAELSIEETDADNHVWTVNVSASDAAGNTVEASYDITVTAKKTQSASAGASSGTGSSSGSTASSGTSAGTESSSESVASSGSGSSSGSTSGSSQTSNGHPRYVYGTNGIVKDTEGYTVEEYNEENLLANAGFYNPVKYGADCYAMIYEDTGNYSDYDAAFEYLYNYVVNDLGLTMDQGTGGYYCDGVRIETIYYK
jgi:hypothetical protein